jgi:signal transduction histidine kinase
VEALAEVAVLVPDGASRDWAAVLIVAGTAGCLAVRRRYPIAALLVAMPLSLAANALGRDCVDHMVTPFFAMLLILYGVGRHLEGLAVPVLAAYALACVLTSQALDEYDDSLGNYLLTGPLLVAAPIVVGRVLRHRARLNRALLDKARRLERERVESAAAAAEEERTRIAAELHDVVAHALSAMVVQASAARRLAQRDPARAGDAFLAVESSGREALTASSRSSCSAVSWTSTAPSESSICSRRRAPTIGTITACPCWARSHAIAVWADEAPRSAATAFSSSAMARLRSLTRRAA